MHFVIRMLHIGWRVRGKRDWAKSPNEWAILKPCVNAITSKRLLEKKVKPGSKFGVLRLCPRSPRTGFRPKLLSFAFRVFLAAWLKTLRASELFPRKPQCFGKTPSLASAG